MRKQEINKKIHSNESTKALRICNWGSTKGLRIHKLLAQVAWRIRIHCAHPPYNFHQISTDPIKKSSDPQDNCAFAIADPPIFCTSAFADAQNGQASIKSKCVFYMRICWGRSAKTRWISHKIYKKSWG